MTKVDLSDGTIEDLRTLGERAAQLSRRLSMECAIPITAVCRIVGQSVGTRLTREYESARRARMLGFDWLHFAMAIDAMHRR